MSPQTATLRSHTTFLAEASQVLSRSLDYVTTLDEIARLYVPLISDCCCIDMVEEGAPRRVAVAHVDPLSRQEICEHAPFSPAWQTQQGVCAVLQGAPAIFIPDTQVPGDAALPLEALAGLPNTGAKPVSLIIVPLRSRNRTMGSVTLALLGPDRRFGREDLALAQDVAARAAGAIENALLYSNAERARTELEQARREADRAARRASFLATVTKAINTSLDQELILSNLTHMIVPEWADVCYAELLEPNGRMTQVAEAARDESQLETLRALRAYPSISSAVTLGHVAVTTQCTEMWHAAASSDEAGAGEACACQKRARLMGELQLTLVVAVPLVARNTTLGAITFGTNAVCELCDHDVSLLEEVVHRAALALENARLYVEAQEAVALRDEFLSIASHELRTPLTALQLQLGQLARMMPKAIQSRVGERFFIKLQRACHQTTRLGNLIDNLLDVSRVTSGRLGVECRDVDLAALIRDVCVRWTQEASRAGCTLDVQLPDRIIGFWDGARLDQVLTILLSNAVKYGAHNNITVTAQARDGWAVVSVRDGGLGIAPEAIDRIFERFERAVSVREFGGLGLGLFIARQIVEAHGGAVTVESRLHQGSTFTVTLPICPTRFKAVVLENKPAHNLKRDEVVSYEHACTPMHGQSLDGRP